jgi:hypothetical protein
MVYHCAVPELRRRSTYKVVRRGYLIPMVRYYRRSV